MKRALFVAVSAFVACVSSCVPSEPDKNPRGGISITFAPSEATAGKPFVTFDGWTVTFEKSALRVGATAVSAVGGGGASVPHVIDPRWVCELRVTQLPPGPALVSVQIETADPRYIDVEREGPCGVDDETFARFTRNADDDQVPPEVAADYYSLAAPSVYVKARAEKAGRVLRFEFGLAVNSTASDFGSYDESGVFHFSGGDESDAVMIVANEGAPVRFGVHEEAMFAGGVDRLAAADANGDGDVTWYELQAIVLPCESSSPSSSSSSGSSPGSSSGFSSSGYADDDDEDGPPETVCRTLLEDLELQMASIIDRRPLPR